MDIDQTIDLVLTRLDFRSREVFERLARRLTQISIWNSQAAHDTSEAAYRAGFSLRGHISGLREAMCIVLGLDLEEGDHEMGIYRYMERRWEAENWAGWPGDEDQDFEHHLIAVIKDQWRDRLPHEPCGKKDAHESHPWGRGRPRTESSRWCEGRYHRSV